MRSVAKRPEFTLLDWAAAHDVTVFDLQSVVESLQLRFQGTPTQVGSIQKTSASLSLEEAWAMVATCFEDHFPAQHRIIAGVCKNVVPTQVASDHQGRAQMPYTRDVGSAKYPIVMLAYSGSPFDLLSVAHEFAHAVQIVASRGAFNPPVMREVSAFLGELVLLKRLADTQPETALLLETAHAVDSTRYLRRDLHHLKRALSAPYSAYDYRWNYPIARVFADEAIRELRPDDHWAIFQGKVTFPELAKFFAQAAIPLRNASPPLSILGYANLGYRVLRFVDRPSEGGDISIGSFYDEQVTESQFEREVAAIGGSPSLYCLHIGYILCLLGKSEYHRSHDLRRYFRLDVLPALSHHQFKLYLSEAGDPDAFVTWAWLDVESERQVHHTGRALKPYEWNSGHRLFFNDWVSPHGNIRNVLKDMVENVMPGARATSLRRNPDASVKRVCRWSSAKGDLQ